MLRWNLRIRLPYRVWAHTVYGMKMTMHIDEVLLERVMEKYGLETKTDAVNFALNELDRKARLRAMLEEGLGLTAEELGEAVYEGYDPENLRIGNPTGWTGGESSRVAEPEAGYGTKRPD